MKFIVKLFGFFCLVLQFSSSSVSFFMNELLSCSHSKNISAAYLGPAQLIRQKGYPSETHIVQTEDGYLLSMNRIPHGISSNNSANKGPVLILHGFLGQSIDFLLLQPEKDLAFMLADAGYDVWIGNFRGNIHSTAHISLTPCENSFWDFTWHESGLYDLPAMIDFVLKTTKAKQLEYMGHSMGTTAFFVLMSTKPEYNEKIAKGHMLGPVAFLKNIRSPLIKTTAFLYEIPNIYSQIFTSGALLTNSELFRLLRKITCVLLNLEKKLCVDAIFLITGSDSQEFDSNLIEVLAYHYPAGYSAKALAHYAQLYLSGEFRQYDYGATKNMDRYGSPIPPSYDLKNITAPTVLYVGTNDYLGTLKDAKKLSKFLPSLKDFYVVKFPKFNHLDFLFATDAKTLLYDEIMQRLSKD